MDKLNKISLEQVDIVGDFWLRRQGINRDTTINCVYDRFNESNRFDALDCVKDKNFTPHIYWDSDTAKWIEASSFILAKGYDVALDEKIKRCIQSIKKSQRSDGYFNSYFLSENPSGIFKDRTAHELYCLGHLIEAAVAYDEAVKNDSLLKIVEKYIDYVEKIFVKDKSASFVTPGHEEIELALIKLYRHTKNKKYLSLAEFFINNRALNDEEEYPFANHDYTQSDKPVRELEKATGHAVRAVYLYSAMADLARETCDEELLSACKKLFEDIVTHKMYITGGIGSTNHFEMFTYDYNLPNDMAYSETCAGIGFALFLDRMCELDINGKYSDLFEQVVYNNVFAGISLKGDSFYYVNPLEAHKELTEFNEKLKSKMTIPLIERVKLFECSCCPPNICRFIAEFGNFIYKSAEENIYVNHFVSSCYKGENGVEIKQSTLYPYDGKIEIDVKNVTKSFCLFVRIPKWSKNNVAQINGDDVSVEINNGYYSLLISKDTKITINLDMSVRFINANSRVYNNVNKVAVMRGALVFCGEGIDNSNLFATEISSHSVKKIEYDDVLGVIITLYGNKISDENMLYYEGELKKEKCELRLIPYYAWSNRGKTDMAIWLNNKTEEN